ncbi:chemotaxis protein CheB, partial [Polaromonas glacialis]|uniref:chemotaxis protein CheB n=1 Tax=Polaromonas glacialis TaxID=866564 RepID=UPI00049565FF
MSEPLEHPLEEPCDFSAPQGPGPHAPDFPVVGLGASAGGLQALMRFFQAMPAQSGMAFVVILHLAPTQASSAADILQRTTGMPVQQVQAPTALEANHVYVIPPGHGLTMQGGELRLSELEHIGARPVVIDQFFRSLAQAHQERAIAIVLSGTGQDGAAGLSRIKECCGISLAQLPEEAKSGGMPQAAIATGMVDFIEKAADMPQRLVALWANACRIRLPGMAEASQEVMASQDAQALRLGEEALRDILALLRTHTKNDFRQYKRATVLRRIERRLQIRCLPDLPAYRDYLRAHPEEVQPLLQDLLISVTNFFRDPAAFEALEREVLPGLLFDRSPDEPVRVWVAGCATGEEAYSVAILLKEQMELNHCTSELQIFATDMDERAVNFGRNALYPASIANDVSPARLKRFFLPEKEQFRVVKPLRESVLFAHHNVLRDPPFSRIDLMCCCNLLSYLNTSAQARVLGTFRFALKPEGILFLGSSEAVDAAPNLFAMLDTKSRFFKLNPNGKSIRHLLLAKDPPPDRLVFNQRGLDRRAPKPASFSELHHKLISQMVSPSALIDGNHSILHLSENVGKFLLLGSDTPSVNLLDNTPAELRTELRTALYQAAQAVGPVKTRALSVQRGGSSIWVQLTVWFFGEEGQQSAQALVMFEEVLDKRVGSLPSSADQANQAPVELLQTEIRQLKENLQQIIEQSETSNEELKSSNQEQQAVNEELRSASEELETSQEELQSTNEELSTVNFELKSKVDEVSMMNDDLKNLMASSDIATIFVDPSLHIKRFTPQATRLFNLIESDINRPLMDIAHKLDYPSLASDVTAILKTLALVERPVSSSDGRQYLAHLRPYRTTDDHIDGVVLTFVDVTELRKAEESVRAGEDRLRIAAETTQDYAILTLDEEGLITTWNQGAEQLFGYLEQDAVSQPYAMLFTPEACAVGAPEEELRGAREEGRSLDERWHLRKDGSTFFGSGVVTRLEGKAGGFAKITRDMTKSRSQQVRRDELLAMEKQANELKDQFLAVMSHELKHPLNLIQVNTELLLSHPEVRALPEVARVGETIRSAVVSQTKIIDDLLNLSRARTGKLTLRLAPVDLAEMARSIAAAEQEAASKKSLRMNFECQDQEVIALCDRVLTEQVLWNLINNAIKFTPTGGSITVRLGRDGTFATVSVVDTGQGIDPAVLPHIFGMFVQASDQKICNTNTNTNTGLGVGLTLVRDLTVAQSGRVLADSEGIGKGTCFTIWLPLAQEKVQEPPPALPIGHLKGLRILAVDDMINLLTPFSALLRMEGAAVDMASSGQQALEMLDKNSYDLLISDLGMPYMDGYELIRKVRKRPDWLNLKAIALSGYGRQVDKVRALQNGFNAHLSKPATVAHICQSIAQLVPGRSH